MASVQAVGTTLAAVTALAVSIAVEGPGDVPEALERAAEAARDGASLVEWRLDALADGEEGLAASLRLLRESPLPCIATCRPRWEGGAYDGDDQERIAFLEALGTSPHAPRYLDVELAAFQRSANLRQKVELVVDHEHQPRDLKTSLILSAHDFQTRPPDLARRLAAMQAASSCAVCKIAWRARSLRDNLEAFELLRHRGKPLIALCMGPFGLPSRVLAGKFGGFLTFASAEGAAATAPGQPSIRELRDLYRFDHIGPATRVYGVVGWPVEHSRSPLLHNRGFEAVGHDGVYLPLPIPPEWEHFTATMGALVDDPALDFRGASVTLPHKENLLRFVKERGGTVDAASEAIGSANTLVVGDDGALRALNTDAAAALETLVVDASLDRADLPRLRVAVLGAGGAARAVAWALAGAGAKVILFNRDQARAERLAAELSGRAAATGERLSVVAGRPEAISCGCFEVVVNCTPVGMRGGPEPDGSPLPQEFPFEAGVTVFDTVYTPRLTPLLREARSRGARTVGGTGMFLRQAAAQFAAWTGQEAPMEAWTTLLGREDRSSTRPAALPRDFDDPADPSRSDLP